LLGNAAGYEPHSELAMGEIVGRWQERKIFLERFDLLRIRSLSPWEHWFPNKSWQFRVGSSRAKNLSCLGWRCTYAELSAGLGASWRLGPLHLFALADLDLNYGVVRRAAFGPEAGISAALGRNSRLVVEAQKRWRILERGREKQNTFLRAGLSRSLTKNFEIRIGAEWMRGYREGLAKVLVYF
jgi:hypothetical protein